ncbi:MAG: CheW protein [Firmicutes bacterium]|nr:CheW protein [Bacillota bacterium]
MQLVVFALNKEEYGVDISAVNGILRAKKFTIKSIPGSSKEVDGMINLRGKINYVLNLRAKFGFEYTDRDEESKFIMLNINEGNTGWIVDEVTDIVKIDDTHFQSVPQAIYGINTNYIQGIGQIDDRVIIILNPDSMLTAEDYSVINTHEA